MNTDIIKKIEADQLKSRPDVRVGDTVKLHSRISEGDKSRIQIFEGIVIAMKGAGMNRTLTVRKVSFGIGVEKIVPLHSPTLEKIEVVKRGTVRKSKLYYMRDRVGKKAMKIKGSEYLTAEESAQMAVEVSDEVNTDAETTKVVAEGEVEADAVAAESTEAGAAAEVVEESTSSEKS